MSRDILYNNIYIYFLGVLVLWFSFSNFLFSLDEKEKQVGTARYSQNACSSLFIGFLRGGCPRGGGITREP